MINKPQLRASLTAHLPGQGPRIGLSGKFAGRTQPARPREKLQDARRVQLRLGFKGGPLRRGQPGKGEVEGHSRQRPSQVQASRGGEQRAGGPGVCGRRGFASLAGFPGTVRPGEGFRPESGAVTFVFRDLCACPSTWLSPLSPLAPAVHPPASPSRAFTWPRLCSLLHRGPTPRAQQRSDGERRLGTFSWRPGDLNKMSPHPFAF